MSVGDVDGSVDNVKASTPTPLVPIAPALVPIIKLPAPVEALDSLTVFVAARTRAASGPVDAALPVAKENRAPLVRRISLAGRAKSAEPLALYVQVFADLYQP